MSELTSPALRWLADHHGVITTTVLRDCNVGRTTQQRLLDAGVLRTVHKGVFVVASTPATLEQRVAGLCAAHPKGFATGPTAGSLLGLRRMPRTAAIHFSIRHGARVDPLPGVLFRQTTALRDIDRRDLGDGIVVASWARLAFDLAADLPELDLASVLHQVLHERRVTVAELVAIERRLGHPARRGSGRFRRAIERLDGPPHESDPEVRVAEGLRTRGIPIEAQIPVLRPNGRRARIDLGVAAVRWGVELDIHPEHHSDGGKARDARRVRDLHGQGWQIDVVTEADLADVDALCDELALIYRKRCLELDRHPRVSGGAVLPETLGRVETLG